MISILSLCFFLIFPFSAKTTYEDGYLELQVNDPASRAVKGVEFTCAQGCATALSDDAGRVRLKLSPSIKPNDWVYLKVVNQSWALISPWNSQLNVPSFANGRQNITNIIVARKGDKQILSSGESIKALLARALSQTNQFKSLALEKDRRLVLEQRTLSDTERKHALKEIADSVGLTTEELNIAIREWGQKASDPFDRGIYELWERNYPKADELLTLSYNLRKDAKQNADTKFADVAFNLGRAKYEGRKYREAIERFEEALAIRKDDTAIMNWLGDALQQAWEFAGAELLFKRALAIHEQALGKNHLDAANLFRLIDIATSLSNLAELYQVKGRYAEAELLYKRTVTINEQVLGKNAPNTAMSLNNLAGVYYAQGKYSEAALSYNRSLAINEQALEKNYPDIARNLNNLAVLYRSQGKYADAEPLFKRALAINEQALGKNHLETATNLNNLATLYYEQGKYAAVEPLFKHALAIREQTLGKDHPDIANSLSNLAELYRVQGKYVDAEPLFKRALVIYEQTLGKNHPQTAINLSNSARLYQAQGKYVEAEPLFKRAVVILEQDLGKDHPFT